MNLYHETIEILKKHEKTLEDVLAICGSDFQITKEDFVKYANTEYDESYGASEVAVDLLVIGDDWWLERDEYDGSEWWEFKTMPNYRSLPFKKITALTINQARITTDRHACGWQTLANIN